MNARRSSWAKITLLPLGMILAAGSAAGALLARDKGGAIGAVTGATAGGVMGSVVGQPAAGALIGGGLGLGAGTLIGDELRRQKIAGEGVDNQEQEDLETIRPKEAAHN